MKIQLLSLCLCFFPCFGFNVGGCDVTGSCQVFPCTNQNVNVHD